jgi:hypothetical protein
MKKKIFTFNDLEIWQEDDRYFAIYDAGSHQVNMRKDEITEDEANLACSGSEGTTEMLLGLQKRLMNLGEDPYISNFTKVLRSKLSA